MTKFTEKEIKHLTSLARIDCSDEELIKLTEELSKITSYVEQLQEVETKDLVPYSHIPEQSLSSLRDDLPGPTLKRETLLNNAPDQVGGMIRVPPVIKKSHEK
ncbi:MAG: Asp-tRNA(Asn)/Glu-tRNA(Gln) amidotransferase subunit GatC [Chlamydiia bacterium]|nr:Asp-tRNA(Asn)/Glu-tRNA(Gln) amidotransferase subunit GatC [Chlamydiia bacterium]